MIKSLVLFIICSIFIFPQTNDKNRSPNQKYIDDSTNVFWTIYPNPFSPPLITDTSKGLFCGEYGFYCALSDTVFVAFQNQRDSIVYSKEVISRSPDFSFCLWIAGSQINHKELPKKYFQCDGKEKIKLFLIINGSKKCYREIYILNKRYYWIR
ncbi:MAG: hypothetical protein P8Z35_05645 [Ignavibacteriaceae bacterium]|jgi:hypothetical protein